jgi:Histidine phosphatase superfamily (branch 1)
MTRATRRCEAVALRPSQPFQPLQPSRRTWLRDGSRWTIATLMACSVAGQVAWSQPLSQASPTEASWQALREGAIVLFRHAEAPGIGDPPGFKLGDCSTQRNLDATGRRQSQQLGDAIRAQQVPVTQVWASPWCRTTETAQIIAAAVATRPAQGGEAASPVATAPLAVQGQSAFGSFFQNRSDEPAQTATARQLLLNFRGPGSLVVVTHNVNITALTGLSPAAGEGVVLKVVTKTAVKVPGKPETRGLAVVGRIPAP